MKKVIISTIMVIGLLLLASCGEREGIGPIEIPETGNTPTPIVVPTCTPTVTPTPDPAKAPAVTEAVKPTEVPEPSATTAPSPEPTELPQETVTPVPTVTSTVTPTTEPTATATPIPSPEPTEVPQETVIPSPEPTATLAPQETVTPEPTELPQETVTPEATPTPTIDPKPLVYRGWQQTVSIDDEYLIIFPEMFRDSTVEKTETELRTDYICAEDEPISFQISYVMQKTLEESVSKIPDVEGSVLEILPEEQRAEFRYREDGMIYRGIMVECRYAQELLGDAFGEEEWITGVMQVIFAYPEERKNEYETVTYSYFVVNNGEE